MTKFNDSKGRTRALGKFRAIVTDDQDPEKRGRIKVKCPYLIDDLESDWIEVEHPFPGFLGTPPKNSAIYVECLEGDPTFMKASGTWYGLPDGKTDAPFNGDPKNFGWQTPKGNKIVMNEDGSIEMQNIKGAKVKMDDNAITITGGSVTLDGSTVSVKNTALISGGGNSAARVGDLIKGTDSMGGTVFGEIITGSGKCFIGG